MGAVSLHENSLEKLEAGRRALAEDQLRDPVIEAVKAQPVEKPRYLTVGNKTNRKATQPKRAKQNKAKSEHRSKSRRKNAPPNKTIEAAIRTHSSNFGDPWAKVLRLQQEVSSLRELVNKQALEIARLEKLRKAKGR